MAGDAPYSAKSAVGKDIETIKLDNSRVSCTLVFTKGVQRQEIVVYNKVDGFPQKPWSSTLRMFQPVVEFNKQFVGSSDPNVDISSAPRASPDPNVDVGEQRTFCGSNRWICNMCAPDASTGLSLGTSY